MKRLSLLFFIVIATASKSLAEDVQNSGDRTDRRMFLPFVKIVIPPDPCGSTAESSGVRVPGGMCLPLGKCDALKGNRNGDCANGFGECCRFEQSCNSSNTDVDVTKEIVQLKSPSPIDTDCTYNIKRKPKYCAVKLDFVMYSSQKADFNGNCMNDSFTVRGSSTVRDGFQVCGSLTGQHMYLAFGKSDTIELRPSFSRSSGGYNIVITQIPCISPLRVPDYCLQYFNTTKGTVRSFGFGEQQISNQRYTTCFGGLTGGGQINLRRCADNGGSDAFRIADKDPVTGDVPCDKDRDWIQLNGEDRMCSLPNATDGISSTFAPFLLNVNFNNNERPDLPFVQDILSANTEALCTALTTKPHLSGIYEDCHWNAAQTPNMCTCYLSPPLLKLYGPVDVNNSGFCLDFAQS